MGLVVTVGILADLLENDEEGAKLLLDQLFDVNKALGEANFQEHTEPRDCKFWEAEGYGYSGLHALREVAGMVWRGIPIPTNMIITGKVALNDALLFNAILPHVSREEPRGFLTRFFNKKTAVENLSFCHLVCHSDAEGCYVPIDFPMPLTPSVMNKDVASIFPVGSVQQLKSEIDRLAEVLELPSDMTSEDEEWWDILDDGTSPVGCPMWRSQPIASYSAIILREACDVSLKSGAAIFFT